MKEGVCDHIVSQAPSFGIDQNEKNIALEIIPPENQDEPGSAAWKP
jgi:hypothetical protein